MVTHADLIVYTRAYWPEAIVARRENTQGSFALVVLESHSRAVLEECRIELTATVGDVFAWFRDALFSQRQVPHPAHTKSLRRRVRLR